MPRNPDLSRVLVIGSGPIIIGQAAEFDYAGTQACRALREEGLEVILCNTNPATIMTDAGVADRVYFEPLHPEALEAVIARERPQGLLPTLGGQVGLNLAVRLAELGVLDRYGVRLLGTPLDAIRRAEDRRKFKQMMLALGEPVPASAVVTSVAEAQAFAEVTGYPLVARPAYTLGGTGGGHIPGPDNLEPVVARGLRASPIGQVLLEQSVAGYKEVEYEVMRDRFDTCIAVCNMENFDPVGVHTGDSIVVAPSQTLTDRDYQRLRSAALRIIRALGVEGGCNIQFALDPRSDRYYVIEVNPRVSRSSALASKATGYPIAKVAAKVAVGLGLDEIQNPVTRTTYACFEPALDYVVVKVPRWPFDKFQTADRRLGTEMKSTGEVMAIDRTFEGALLKAVRSLDARRVGLSDPELGALDDAALADGLAAPSDTRLFQLYEALRRGWSAAELSAKTGVDPWFLKRLDGLVRLEREVVAAAPALSSGLLRRAKARGLADATLAALVTEGLGAAAPGAPADVGAPPGPSVSEADIRALRTRLGIVPAFKMVDTCAAEFEAGTPYFYSTYDLEDEAAPDPREAVLVLGSGPIRIGQGVEFDYCSVHAVWALRAAGYRALIVNNNPETVSTDFDTSDRLYFEPLTLEDVLNVAEKERPRGVLVQFGGQTAINLAGPLHAAGVPILGTPPDAIDVAEDRGKFDALLRDLGIPRPPGGTARSAAEALAVAGRIGYPVVVRPSYVLGGRAMEIVYEPAELEAYLEAAVRASDAHPVLIDRYLPGVELEVEAVADGETVLVGGVIEHVERAGVHSGDSIAVTPPQSLAPEVVARAVDYSTRIALALGVRGLLNLQFVVAGDGLYVLEANPRASRTVPYLSKVAGIPLVALATRVAVGARLADLGYSGGLWAGPPGVRLPVAVKAPVFSWPKLPGVEPGLGPEMKSTGEVLGLDESYAPALYKALWSAGTPIPVPGGGADARPVVLFTVADRDKPDAVELCAGFRRLGYEVWATAGTAAALEAAGIPARRVRKLTEGPPTILDHLREGRVALVVNTLTRGKQPQRDGFQIRRAAVEAGVPCLTSLDTARAALRACRALAETAPGAGGAAGGAPGGAPGGAAGILRWVRALQDYLGGPAAGTPSNVGPAPDSRRAARAAG